MTKVPFDKEKFINNCCPACAKVYAGYLDKIEFYRETDPEISQALQHYVDDLWDKIVKDKKSHKLTYEENIKSKAATALRAMADTIENRYHLLLYCELPEIPIFSGEDDMISHIQITLASRPLGG